MNLTFKQFLILESHDLESLDRKWERKPSTWHEIYNSLSQQDSKQAGFTPENLPLYHVSDLWHRDHEEHLPRPHDTFDETPDEDVFMLDVPGEGMFLIKRSGHDYVRYALKA